MEDIKNIEDIKKIVGCCEQWPNCEGHMDSHEEIFAKEVIENLLKEVEPIKEEKSPKTGCFGSKCLLKLFIRLIKS